MKHTRVLISKFSAHDFAISCIKVVAVNSSPHSITAVLYSPFNCVGAIATNQLNYTLKTTTCMQASID